MAETTALRFGPFRLAGKHGPLLRDGEEIKLQPKTQALLWALVRQPGEVVPKSVLMDSAWPGVVVSDDALTFQVQVLRRALGDDPKSPRYVVTAHRVGFRFAVPVERGAATPAAVDQESRFVGREAELQTLQAHLASAASGQRRVVFVSGEAGIGKTTLIDSFLERARAGRASWVHARGQCPEQRDAGEPYLPLLQALGQLLREASDDSAIELVRRVAPSWLLQLPGLIEADDYVALKRRTEGVSQSRMQRELAEALERLSAEQTLVWILEDLHWSDSATLDVLALLAPRREPARLLVLCSLRSVDAIVSDHPVRKLQLGLRSRGQAVELELGRLAPEAVLDYLSRRFRQEPLTAAVTGKVTERSGGHPLFMSQIADYLEYNDRHPGGRAAELDQAMPQRLLDLIELQLGQLGLTEQLVLEGASVAGIEFSAAAAGAAAGLAADAAELHFERLARTGQFVEAHGLAVWPDGTTSGRYRFRHMLYADVLRRRLLDSRRARMDRLIAERMEAAYGARSPEIAAELALHYERGGARAKALPYRVQTAELALQRVVPQEVHREVALGLALLDELPPGLERRRAELSLRVIAVRALQAEQGYASTQAQMHMDRMASLLEGINDPALMQRAVVTLWNADHFRGHQEQALVWAERVRSLGVSLNNPTLECWGLTFAGTELQLLGRHREAERSCEQALQLAGAGGGDARDTQVAELMLVLQTIRAINFWYLGFPDRALQVARDVVAYREPNALDPFLTRTASINLARQFRREWVLLLSAADEAISISQKYGQLDSLNWARRQRAVALCELGRWEEGLPALREGLAAQIQSGSPVGLPMDYCHEACCCMSLGRVDEARAALDKAFAIARGTGVRAWEPEVLRTEGLWLLARDGRAIDAACERFEQALQLAQSRQALMLQLRAATSLARLWEIQGCPQRALDTLQPVYAAFTEGHEVRDLVEARELLDRLSTTRGG